MTDLPTPDPAGQEPERVPSLQGDTPLRDRAPRWQAPIVGAGYIPDNTDVWPQVRPWGQRLLQLSMHLNLAQEVLQSDELYHVPDGMTVEVWYDTGSLVRPSRDAWSIRRICRREDIRSPFPIPESSDTYFTIHALYRVRIQVEGSPAWFVAWWEPAAKSSGGRVVETLHGIEVCTNPAQAVTTLTRAQEWLRGNTTRRGRHEGQVTGTLPPAIQRAIYADILRFDAEGWSQHRIAEYLNEMYPAAQYERERWNHTTVGRWKKRAKREPEQN